MVVCGPNVLSVLSDQLSGTIRKIPQAKTCHITRDRCVYQILTQTSVLTERDRNDMEHSQIFGSIKKGILKSVIVSAKRNWSRTKFSRSSTPGLYQEGIGCKN